MDVWQNLVLAGRYKLSPQRCLGTGGTARVHQGSSQIGIDLKTTEKVAIKLILATGSAKLLENESQVLTRLRGRHFPKMLWYGEEQECEWEIMELLGESVLKHFERCEAGFSLKTVLMIAEQLLEALEEMHSQGVVHMDIKPDNIMFGVGSQQDILYLIDFGISKLIENPARPEGKKTAFKGNIMWASVNLLKLGEGSQRDDLEAMMYTLLFLLKGELPWMRLPEPLLTYASVLKYKDDMKPASLFEGVPMFLEMFMYIRSLKFQEMPDYAFLHKKIRKAAQKASISFDLQFDWKQLSEPVSPDSHCMASFDAVEKPRHKRRLSPSNKPHKQVARLEANSPIRSPGSLLRKSMEHFLAPGDSGGFQLRLSPVLMADGSPEGIDVLSLDECPRASPDSTPKSSSPVLRPSIRNKFRRLKAMNSANVADG